MTVIGGVDKAELGNVVTPNTKNPVRGNRFLTV